MCPSHSLIIGEYKFDRRKVFGLPDLPLEHRKVATSSTKSRSTPVSQASSKVMVSMTSWRSNIPTTLTVSESNPVSVLNSRQTSLPCLTPTCAVILAHLASAALWFLVCPPCLFCCELAAAVLVGMSNPSWSLPEFSGFGSLHFLQLWLRANCWSPQAGHRQSPCLHWGPGFFASPTRMACVHELPTCLATVFQSGLLCCTRLLTLA